MTAEELDELAAEVGRLAKHHQGCDMECDTRKALELARGYLSLRLVQADHERQIAALGESKRFLQEESDALQRQMADLRRERAALQTAYDGNFKTAITLEGQIKDVLLQNKALQAAYDDVQAALMKSIANTERAQSLLLTYTKF